MRRDFSFLQQLNDCHEEASQIFCDKDLHSCAANLTATAIQIGATHAWILVTGEAGELHCMDGKACNSLPGENFIDYLPILYTQSESVQLEHLELRGFLQQVDLAHDINEQTFAFFFAVEVMAGHSAYFVCVFQDIAMKQAQDCIKALENFYGNLLSAAIYAKQGSSLQQQVSSAHNRQSIWLESLAWLNQASRNLEAAGYDNFFQEAIFQLSVLVKSDECALHKLPSNADAPMTVIKNLNSPQFDQCVTDLIGRDIQFEKGAFTHIDANSRHVDMLDGLRQILLFPVFLGKEVRMVVSIGKREQNFEDNEIVFASLFCEGIQATVERRNLILSIQRKNMKLVRDKEELQTLNKQLSQTQEKLLQQEKMASIGQLAAGVAHEINNPIGYVNSNIGTMENYMDDFLSVVRFVEELKEREATKPELAREIQQLMEEYDIEFLKDDSLSLLKESKEGLKRVKQIVQDLRDFSHVDEAEWVESDLIQGIDATLNIVANEVKYKAKVIKEYHDIPNVACIPSQVNQVVMNLLVNASHAIEGQGEISIKTWLYDDKQVAIQIRDTGVGISQENLTKIFDPFYTTKPVGSGTGLGLWLSFSIVEKHSGQLLCDSEVGVGTAFTLVLPIKQNGSSETAVYTMTDKLSQEGKHDDETNFNRR